jgi:small neutral amino acid transporter SnatA (MarC family)
MAESFPWLTLALLGAYHGMNPGMGWLFAVALGLQERSRSGVLRAFAPITLGHALSVAVVVAVVGVAQTTLSVDTLKIAGGIILILFGLYKLLAPMSHPRWVGMRVNFRDLTAWSFLMASAHGAGLMLVPVLLGSPDLAAGQHETGAHIEHMALASSTSGLPLADVAAVVIHTVSMFVVMGLIAIVVYDKLGLAILRRAWFNVDRIWAVALIGAGLVTFVL